ncbi:response regulator [Alteromonas gracilis]|uniref:response regulator n=1 Tax=Alteromonas gracilis TaxID=1479524 RepID=UPI0030D3D02E
MDLLIVEQDATQVEIYELAFSEHFTVHTARNMLEAVTCLKDNNISIVISDWKIGKTKASIFCEQLDTSNPLTLPVVIVVSQMSDDDTIREAFNAGVSHYITKPYSIVPFTETVLGAKHQIQIMQQMHADNADTREVAQTALSQAAIYGTGMEIVSALNTCNDIHAMSKNILTTLRFNGVHAAIQYRDDRDTTSYDTDMSACDATTEKVFTVLHDQGRIYRFGKRLMLNDENVSLLVKHVAREDPVIHDAILDMGAKLVPAINARFNSLRQQQALRATHTDISSVIDQIRQIVIGQAQEKARVAKSVSESIQDSFHMLELTEVQEAFFMQLIESQLEASDELAEIQDVDNTLQGILTRLAPQLTAFEEDTGEAKNDSDDDLLYQDVEFF